MFGNAFRSPGDEVISVFNTSGATKNQRGIVHTLDPLTVAWTKSAAPTPASRNQIVKAIIDKRANFVLCDPKSLRPAYDVFYLDVAAGCCWLLLAAAGCCWLLLAAAAGWWICLLQAAAKKKTARRGRGGGGGGDAQYRGDGYLRDRLAK
eukprot:SAG11_NODE_3385_length_2481_cov_2.969773_1_plen_149_part_10